MSYHLLAADTKKFITVAEINLIDSKYEGAFPVL